MNTVIQMLVYQNFLVVTRNDKQIDIYDMSNSFLCSTTFTVKQNITSVVISTDALSCDCLVVGTQTGYMEMFNISHGFKMFTSAMAYCDAPVNKTATLFDALSIDRGMLTVGNDGCISVWQWQKPKKDFGGHGK